MANRVGAIFHTSLPFPCRVPVSSFRQRSGPPTASIQFLSSSLGILHITAPAVAGGLESVVQLLARSQQAAGQRVTVAAAVSEDDGEHPFLRALAENGVESAAVRVGAKGYIREWRGLRALLLANKPDIVHTHGYRSDVMGSLASAGTRVGRVTTVHGFTGGDIKNRTNEWIQIRSFRTFDAVVPVSGQIVQRLRKAGVPTTILHPIPNAIDTRRAIESRADARRRLGVAEEEFVIGWVGRMSNEKGLDVLIQALRTTQKPVKAIFIGDGPSREWLQDLAASIGVGPFIQWQGLVRDAASLFSAFDVFALSSRTEGVPIVLLEAMRAGVPIVATSVGGIPEMLGEDEALLVATDQPDALAVAIDAVRTQVDAAKGRACAARARLERDFTTDVWVERYDAVYRSVLDNRAREL